MSTSPPRPSLSERMKVMLAEYGSLALVLYLIIFALVLFGFATAISFGVAADSTAGSAGVLAAAWVATKVTQPLRILATLALTPVVATVLKRLRRRPPETETPPPPAAP